FGQRAGEFFLGDSAFFDQEFADAFDLAGWHDKFDYRPLGAFIKITSGKYPSRRYLGTDMAIPAFKILASAVPAVAPHVVRGLMSTCSYRVIGRDIKEKYVDADGPFIGVLWHKDFLFALDFFRRRKIVVMVSRSKDGELVARALHRLGYRTVRGSSSAGGREALSELTDLVRSGWGS